MGKAKNSAKQEKQANSENMTQAFDPREKTLDEDKRDILHELLLTKPGFSELVEQFRELIKGDPNTIRALKDLCPESDADGALDFNGMLRAMGAYTSVDLQNDGYVFTWPGKQKAIQLGNEPTDKVLIPDKADSKDWDTTQNIYIEADNLEALKCLRNTYAGKIKMIYIDPPYNTGNDFIYPDDFHGKKVTSDDAGKHTKWLNMMYPRLMLARELLSEDGVIFISIDDNEVANLKEICDKIFGAGNFLAQLVWKSKSGGANDSKYFAIDHEYILCIAKNVSKIGQFLDREAEATTSYNRKDERGEYALERLDKQSLGYQESLDFPIIGPDGKEYTVNHKNPNAKVARWRWGKETVKERYNELVFKNGCVYTKNYKKDETITRSILFDERFGRTRTGKTDLFSIFNLNIFDNPKPIKLLRYLLMIATNPDSYIMDFFAGSSTMAHAVMQLNSEDGGNRKYIMMQKIEPCDRNTNSGKTALEAGYKTIAEIGKARIDKAGDKIKADNPLTTKDLDIGFRVFRVGESNIPKWWKVGKDASQLELFENNVKQETEAECNDRYRAICYEIMLKHKCLLSAHVDEYLTPEAMKTTGGKPLFVVDGGLFICPVGGVNEAWAQAIVKLYESKYKLPPMEELNKDNSWTVIVNDDATPNAMNNDDTRDSDMNRAASTLIDAGLPKGKFLYI